MVMVYVNDVDSDVGSLTVARQLPLASGSDAAMAEVPPTFWSPLGQLIAMVRYVSPDQTTEISIAPVPVALHAAGTNAVDFTVDPPARGMLRVILRKKTPDGFIRRTWAGGPPSGQNMAKVFALSARQGDRTIPVRLDYDKIVWSGMSWAVGEIDSADLQPGQPLIVHFHSAEKDSVTFDGSAYLVQY